MPQLGLDVAASRCPQSMCSWGCGHPQARRHWPKWHMSRHRTVTLVQLLELQVKSAGETLGNKTRRSDCAALGAAQSGCPHSYPLQQWITQERHTLVTLAAPVIAGVELSTIGPHAGLSCHGGGLCAEWIERAPLSAPNLVLDKHPVHSRETEVHQHHGASEATRVRRQPSCKAASGCRS